MVVFMTDINDWQLKKTGGITGQYDTIKRHENHLENKLRNVGPFNQTTKIPD